MNKYVVGIGEVLWDCIEEAQIIILRQLGGAPGNFSFHVKQFGLNGYAISAIGDDNDGHDIESIFQEKGIPYMLPYVDYATGRVLVKKDKNGQPQYSIVENCAWDYIPWKEEMKEIAANTQAVCFGSLAQRNPVSRQTIYRFLDATPADALRIFDINLRENYYSKEIIEESLKRANVLKINDDELVVMQYMWNYLNRTPETTCRHFMKQFGLDILILTCGNKGSYVFAKGCKMSFLSTKKVKVVDTVGAGDSFTASFIATLLQGKSIRQAHRIAGKVSAFVCTKAGATPYLPKKIKR